MNYQAMLGSIMQRGRLVPFSAAPIIGVSVPVLQTFIAGMPVKERCEAKIIKWVEAKI